MLKTKTQNADANSKQWLSLERRKFCHKQ